MYICHHEHESGGDIMNAGLFFGGVGELYNLNVLTFVGSP